MEGGREGEGEGEGGRQRWSGREGGMPGERGGIFESLLQGD